MDFKYKTTPESRAKVKSFLAWARNAWKFDTAEADDALDDLETALAERVSLMGQVAALEDENAKLRAAQSVPVSADDLGVWPR